MTYLKQINTFRLNRFSVANCRILNIWSSCIFNIKYIYDKNAVLALDDHHIDAYFYDSTSRHVKHTCKEFAEILKAMETWQQLLMEKIKCDRSPLSSQELIYN
jgi:hypothetical protein